MCCMFCLFKTYVYLRIFVMLMSFMSCAKKRNKNRFTQLCNFKIKKNNNKKTLLLHILHLFIL